jgi:hypothetical protein
MTTWKIWRALHNPPSLHPVFQRTVLRPPALLSQRSFGWAGLVVNLVLGLGQYSPTILLVLMPFILIFTGITYGLDCAIRVGSTIAKERENDTFNLLSLSPSGALGASWAICTSALYRNRDFDRLHNVVRGSIIIMMITITIIALLTLALRSDNFSRVADPSFITIIHLIDLTAVVVAIYIEYIQSAILGTLIGMFVPTYTQNRVDTSVYAMGGFLLLQITTYFLAYFFGFVILSDLYDWLKLHGDYSEISLSILRLGAFFVIREVMITTLWRALVERLNAQPSELELAMQFAP